MHAPSGEQPATLQEIKPGFLGALSVTLPGMGLGMVSTLNPSEPGHPNPIREIDILGIPDLLDHSGSIHSGSTTAFIIISGCTLATTYLRGKYAQERFRGLIIVGTGVLGAAGTAGLEIAYEAGENVRPYEQKPTNEPFDGTDALFGSISGILTAIAFCTAALKARRRE